jgi:hypothetical protein
VDDFTQVDPVLEQVVERTRPERAPAQHFAGRQNTLFAPDATLFEVCPQFSDTAES